MKLLDILFGPTIPQPAHLRQSPDNAATTPRQPRQSRDITYMAGRAWVHQQEHTEGGAVVDVHDIATPGTAQARSPQVDSFDEAQIAALKLKPDVYATLKTAWAQGLGYRAAGDLTEVRNLKGARERTRAAYWKAFHSAQMARTGAEPMQTDAKNIDSLKTNKL